MVSRKLFKQVAPNRALPVELEMVKPIGGFHERWSFTHSGIRDADTVAGSAEMDTLFHVFLASYWPNPHSDRPGIIFLTERRPSPRSSSADNLSGRILMAT
jgi:hypothetical protein